MKEDQEYRTSKKIGHLNNVDVPFSHKQKLNQAIILPASPTIDRHPESNLVLEDVILSKARIVCSKYKLELEKLTTIQRVFLMRYRCHNCGLVPLYHLNLSNMKKAQCKMCGQHVKFSNSGKYGRIRKEIVREIMAEGF